eukprot:6658554-Pyramimonas_sp.AAC.1
MRSSACKSATVCRRSVSAGRGGDTTDGATSAVGSPAGAAADGAGLSKAGGTSSEESQVRRFRAVPIAAAGSSGVDTGDAAGGSRLTPRRGVFVLMFITLRCASKAE